MTALVPEAVKWEESWKPIPGFRGYEVSDFGNVRTFHQKGSWRNQDLLVVPRMMRASTTRHGYRYVSVISDDGEARRPRVHRLVMLAFVGLCPDDQEVAHLNGDAGDNRLENLKYCTHLENESHKWAHGTLCIGEKNANAKLQGWQVEEIKYLASKSIPRSKIAALFDIASSLVSEIIAGSRWAHIKARDPIAVIAMAEERLSDVERNGVMSLLVGRTEAWAIDALDRLRRSAEGGK